MTLRKMCYVILQLDKLLCFIPAKLLLEIWLHLEETLELEITLSSKEWTVKYHAQQ